ncbi:hypothetical protein PUNSTDRAFT_47387 [Punctularia strigosozonata HHB-11173 SS5]|uniref:C2H2-type domain-containing protein n=1 Tax=Punctularia strigosozonata (strain HHB-11173) TaxID=741275 RepID=R7S4J9_PUNST|nr:uncharacterized protein PUNSTDRAFT_47387 [Punctularia strigosozonata HHB-11173 SS5]EIN04759.1 hypothetical protein PUNSTDRAFT_47387 [Punctularia strigosozonata HHB-11173 SS5]
MTPNVPAKSSRAGPRKPDAWGLAINANTDRSMGRPPRQEVAHASPGTADMSTLVQAAVDAHLSRSLDLALALGPIVPGEQQPASRGSMCHCSEQNGCPSRILPFELAPPPALSLTQQSPVTGSMPVGTGGFTYSYRIPVLMQPGQYIQPYLPVPSYGDVLYYDTPQNGGAPFVYHHEERAPEPYLASIVTARPYRPLTRTVGRMTASGGLLRIVPETCPRTVNEKHPASQSPFDPSAGSRNVGDVPAGVVEKGNLSHILDGESSAPFPEDWLPRGEPSTHSARPRSSASHFPLRARERHAAAFSPAPPLEALYSCCWPGCERYVVDYQEGVQHLKFHIVGMKAPWMCAICEKIYSKKYALVRHLKFKPHFKLESKRN